MWRMGWPPQRPWATVVATRPGGRQIRTSGPTVADTIGDEAPVRYLLGGGRIGVERIRSYLRTLFETAFWSGVAPLPVRMLFRVGAHRMSAWAQRQWARGVGQTLGVQIDRHGLEHIDPDETYVITPLHEGFADALALLQLPLPLRFVVRDELAEWRWIGSYLRDTGQVIVRPEAGVSAFRGMVRQAQEVFAMGESLIVFPQGSILGIETDFLPGAFALARVVNRPILPIAITGSHRVWEHPYGPRLRRRQRISLRVLKPISAAEVRAQPVDETRRKVQGQLKAEALGGSMVPPRHFLPCRDGFWDDYSYEIDPAFPELAREVTEHRRRHAATSERHSSMPFPSTD
jgi:1-acyl-sn-glycerol-3-phosphate acyltransferase